MSSRAERLGIKDRLLSVVRTRYGTRERFRDAFQGELSLSAVTKWLNPKSGLPNGENLLLIAQRTGVSPTWLLTDDGPELIDASRDTATLAADLRADLVTRLASNLAADVVPAAEPFLEALLDELTNRYRPQVEQLRAKLKEARAEWEQRQRLVEDPYLRDPMNDPRLVEQRRLYEEASEFGPEEAVQRYNQRNTCPECGHGIDPRSRSA